MTAMNTEKRPVAIELHKRSRTLELGYEGDDFGAGIGYAGKLDWTNTMADVDAAIAHVRNEGATSVGITGFCWGGI